MKNLLICTIARNMRPHLDTWYSQILRLAAILKDEYTVTVSVAENDSTDGTAEWLAALPANSQGLPVIVSTEVLGTLQYSSIWSLDRIYNLATARQKCLDQAEEIIGLQAFDKVAYIEPDVTYDPAWCSELVFARHPGEAHIEPDIYSGWSLRTLTNPKESVFLYDTCATRQSSTDVCWDFSKEQQWKGESLIRTNLGGANAMCLHRVWSTFNCFCVYNAKPFIDGHRWRHWNRRINPGSGIIVAHPDGGTAYLDADTVAICEEFRQYGYSKIFLNTNCLVRHA